MKNISYLVFAFAISVSSSAFSQVIPVEPLTKGMFGTQQTMTFPYERSDADLTIVVVPGYPGSVNLKIGDKVVRGITARMMQNFQYRTAIKANVVIFDSPVSLEDIGARSSSDHLGRIESVVKFYGERFKAPVWLFGHSDGSISVSEYLNRSDDTRKSIAGAILSAGRDETRIRVNWSVPVLVLHHERDGCNVTTFNGAKRYFSRIKDMNTGPTEFATVVGGTSSGAPCGTGFHMYEGAFGETLGLIEDFIARRK